MIFKLFFRELESIPKDYDQYTMTRRETLIYLSLGFVVAICFSILFYHNLILCILLLPFVWMGRTPFQKMLANQRKNRLMHQFRDMLYSISASISSGRHMAEALIEARSHLSLLYGAEEQILRELDQMIRRIQESREGVDLVLTDFGKRSGLEDVMNFAEIYSISRGTGGNLDQVVRKASQVMLEKIEIQKEIKVMIVQKQLEIKILFLIPIAILTLLQWSSTDYLSGLYETFTGRILMTCCLVVLCVSYYISSTMVRIEV